jgi:two-component system response regulator HydG
MSKILIVEDEVIIRMALRKLLERNGFDVREVGSVKEATTKYNLENYDLIVSDLRLPGELGTALISIAINTPVLIMTSYASLRSAVDAMRMGAVDYIAKPFDHEEMITTVKRILADRSNIEDAHSKPGEKSNNGMIGDSPVMQNLYRRIEQVAPTDATVLIQGETGTGKELTARAVHQSSKRREHALICINCAAIPETLIESELFGHEKGAFTGAASSREGLVVAADKGTLFLDEIGELPMEAQARLLRVLQEGEVRPVGSTHTQKVNIRLIAATHRDLNKCCREGSFREDLYFRLNVIALQMPPLRDRGSDIITLAEALVSHYCNIYEKPLLALSQEAMTLVSNYSWPGNVRELENAMQRAVILCENKTVIDHDLLSLNIDMDTLNLAPELERRSGNNIRDIYQSNHHGESKEVTDADEDLSLEDYFQRFVTENQELMSETELAKKLGVSRKCLWERRQRLGIPRKKSAFKK